MFIAELEAAAALASFSNTIIGHLLGAIDGGATMNRRETILALRPSA